MQELIHECACDEEIGRPITKLDRELDVILKTGDGLDYVNISLIITQTTRSTDAIKLNTFVPELDDNIVSIFGIAKDTTTKAIGLYNTPIIDVDEKSTLPGITLDSRMSKMGQEFFSMSDMLRILVGIANTGNTVTQHYALLCRLHKGSKRPDSVIRKCSF